MSRNGDRAGTKSATRLLVQRATRGARARARKAMRGKVRPPAPFRIEDFVEVERPTRAALDELTRVASEDGSYDAITGFPRTRSTPAPVGFQIAFHIEEN